LGETAAALPETRSLNAATKVEGMPLFSAAVVVTMLAAQPVQGELLENTTKVRGTATRREAI
jgi:hypothetical protein